MYLCKQSISQSYLTVLKNTEANCPKDKKAFFKYIYVCARNMLFKI